MPVIQPTIVTSGDEEPYMPQITSLREVRTKVSSFNNIIFGINTTEVTLTDYATTGSTNIDGVYTFVSGGTMDSTPRWNYNSDTIVWQPSNEGQTYGAAVRYYATLPSGSSFTKTIGVETLADGDYVALLAVNGFYGTPSSAQTIVLGFGSTLTEEGASAYVLMDLTVSGTTFTFTYNGVDRRIPCRNSTSPDRIIGFIVCVFKKP